MTQILNIVDWLLLLGALALAGIYGATLLEVPKNEASESQKLLCTPSVVVHCSSLLLGVITLYAGVPGTFPYGLAIAATHPLNIYCCVIGSLLVLISLRTSWLSVIRPFLTSTLSSFPWKMP